MNYFQNISSFSSSSFGPMAMLGGSAFFGFLAIFLIVMVASIILIFKKAGRKWWEAIIPFYNMYVWTAIVGKPWWLLIGFFIPVVSWVVSIYLSYHLSKRFGFDIPFTIGLVLLPFIFLPILALGSAVYTPPEKTN